jgi:DNA-binding transcriptional LysR family regulator
MMDIDYNKLKSFLAVVKAGGVTAAAKELNRTQSAVSQAIQSLEGNLRVKLIEWEGKRLKLTREGQLIYKAIETRMEAMEEQLEAILKAGQEVSGTIEIGVLQDHSTKIQEHLLTSMALFRKAYPAVKFQLTFGKSVEIEQALLEGELDIGLLINFKERERFQVFELATEEHLIVASHEYLKSIKAIKHIQDAIAADLIDIDEQFTCLTPWVQKHAPSLVQKLDEKQPVIIVPDFHAAKALILLSQGIGVLPRYLIEKDLANGKIVQILHKLTALRVRLDCAVKRGRKERLCDRLFIHALRLDF